MSTKLAYDIQIANGSNKIEIINYLRRVFFKDEPLNAYLELITETNPTCPTLEEFTVKHLDDGINLLAVQNNNIIGICLCVNVEKGKADPFDCKNEKYNKIVKILDYAEHECDAFRIFPECRVGTAVQVISVDESCRGKGIAAELLKKSCEIAKERGLEFMTITCTGLYSARLAEKLDFQLKYSINYSDYKENGSVVFKPAPPHTFLSVYLKKL